MPHAGLLDEQALGPEKSELVRTRLHIRSGRRRLVQGKVSEGLSTLFDALLSALRWYALSHWAGSRPGGGPGDDTSGMVDEREIHEKLAFSGVLTDGGFFDEFEALMQKAVDKRLGEFDYSDTLGRFESAMNKLGVMPFDEGALPPEDADTY